MKVFLTLFERHARTPDRPCQIYIRCSVCSHRIDLVTGIRVTPDQWDGQRVVRHPQAGEYNRILQSRRSAVELILLETPDAWLRSHSVAMIRDYILHKEAGEEDRGGFADVYREYMSSRTAKRTKDIYRATLVHLERFDARLERRRFEDIDLRYLQSFDAYLQRYSAAVNARNIHFRNIRAVFNHALDLELTRAYPFRRFKLRYEATRHRAISAEELWHYFAQPHQGEAELQDMMRLIFALIGINVTDLYGLKPADYSRGRLRYRRAKTGRLYDIKVEPEAAAIIERWRGRKTLLHVSERYSTAHDLLRAMDIWAKRWDPDQPDMTTYVLRHSWATIAYNDCGIPADTISLALGHATGNRVTGIYIDPSLSLVDKANRKVLDLIYNHT